MGQRCVNGRRGGRSTTIMAGIPQIMTMENGSNKSKNILIDNHQTKIQQSIKIRVERLVFIEVGFGTNTFNSIINTQIVRTTYP
ncbi:unnamed protein product [Macrosiphum euphorbiae]|uniref:Uncharacterized protein n=1 Tax=Macrosiphum euphorbiae TaxID=13131 RepID=A0AAV0VTK4_9HEMI|nr:unnamed protein product [Macrosiphum euphorbiae]